MNNLTVEQQEVLSQATKVLESINFTYDFVVNEVNTTGLYLTAKLAGAEREQFSVLLLNSQHQLIEFNTLFYGDVSSCTVTPSQIVRLALLRNSSAIILCHNHPSGCVTPSEADKNITKRIVDACRLLDIKVLDHIIVGGSNYFSLAQHGYM